MSARLRIRGLAALALGALVLFLAWRGDGPPPSAPGTPGPAPRAEGLPASLDRSPGSLPGVGAATPPPLPASLRGTDVDGGLSVDAGGHFVPDPDALALFDYFLAATGEEPPETIRRRIVARIRSQLAEPAAGEAVALLDTYLGFREALRQLVTRGQAPADLERRWQWIRELRREHFGAANAEALFGDAERTIEVDLERRRVALDESLAPGERAERLAALEEQFPERVVAARRDARAPREVRADVDALRAQGGSEQEVFELREARFGWEAAERLAQLDADRARWRDRLATYRSERDALLEAAGGGPAEDHREALDALRARHFDAVEVLRVRALDEI